MKYCSAYTIYDAVLLFVWFLSQISRLFFFNFLKLRSMLSSTEQQETDLLPNAPIEEHPSSASSKGYLKKLRKKAAAGGINSEKFLSECQQYGLQVHANIDFLGKQNDCSLHDVTLEDLRYLAMSIIDPEVSNTSSRFEVRNKAMLTKVACIHFSNCQSFDLMDRLREIAGNTDILKIRVSKEVSRIYTLPERLFSLSKEDIGEVTCQTSTEATAPLVSEPANRFVHIYITTSSYLDVHSCVMRCSVGLALTVWREN